MCRYTVFLFNTSLHVCIWPYITSNLPSFLIGAIERYLEELKAPTPVGEEPKTVQLIKAITWFGVIALVLVEIFVSIKLGSTPPTGPPATPLPNLQELSYPTIPTPTPTP